MADTNKSSATRAPKVARARNPWRVRWLLPIAVVAAAIIVWHVCFSAPRMPALAADQQWAEQLARAGVADVQTPCWDRTERRIVVPVRAQSGDTYLIGVSGATRGFRVTGGRRLAGDCARFAWMGSNSKVVFSRGNDDPSLWSLSLLDLASGKVTEVGTGAHSVSDPRGTVLVCTRKDADGLNLYAWRPGHPEAQKLTKGILAYDYVLSPDGNRVVVEYSFFPKTRPYQVRHGLGVVATTGGDKLRVIAEADYLGPLAGMAWEDSHTLLCGREEVKDGSRFRVVALDVESWRETTRFVRTTNGPPSRPYWSERGDYAMWRTFAQGQWDNTLVRMDTRTGQTKALDMPARSDCIALSPSGRRVAAITPDNALWIGDFESGKQQRVSLLPAGHSPPSGGR